MKKRLSILLAILLVFGSVSGGFAASGGGTFEADEFVKAKATGSVPDSSAGIAFDVEGEYTNNGINYDFYLTLPPGADQLEVTINGYPAEVGETPASVDYELGDDPYTGNVQQEHVFTIDLTDDQCEDGSIDIDIKWFPPSGSSQEVMHGTFHVTCTPESFNLDVSIEGEGSTNPVEGTHSYEEGTVVDLEADPATGWHFVEWQGPVEDSLDPTTSVEITGNTAVTAVFEINQYDLIVDHIGEGITTPDGTSTHDFEEMVNLEATPATGWHFVEWQGPVGDANDPTTTVEILEMTEVTAVFEKNMYELDVSHTGSGSTVPDGLGLYPFETLVQVTVTPDSGWFFTGWVGPDAGDIVGNEILIDSDKAIVAQFEEIIPDMVRLTITVDGDGMTIPTPGVHQYTSGASVILEAIPDPGWEFVEWLGPVASNGSSQTSILMDEDKEVEAVFVEIPPNMVSLTVTHIGQGSTNPSGTDTVAEGTVVDLVAVPASGWHFVEWLGSVDSVNAAVTSITVLESTTATAVFEPDQAELYTLYIAVDGNGTTVPLPGSHSYEPGETVNLDAIPGSGWFFVDWIGTHGSAVSNGTIEMNGDRWITALFNEEEVQMVTLTVNIQGSGITDPDEGDHEYPRGEEAIVVDLYTSADPGWYFDGWIGDVDDDQVVMDEDKEITAVFKKHSSPPPPIIRNRLSISIEGNGSVEPFVGSQNYLPGTVVDVAADPGTGWVFDGWIGPDGGDVSGGQIQMDDDKNIIAKFVQALPPPPPIEPPEIIIPLTETPLSDGDLPNTGQSIPWLTLILGFGVMALGYFFKEVRA